MAAGKAHRQTRITGVMAASHAPTTERVGGAQSARDPAAPLGEGTQPAHAPIPSLPPAPHPPLRLAPVLLVLFQMLVDLAAMTVAFGLAYWLRFEQDILPRYVEPDMPTYATMLGVTMITMLVTFYFSRLYNLKRGASRVDEFYKIVAAVSIGTVSSLALNSLVLGEGFVYSRQILLTGWLLSIVLVTAGRLLYGVLVGEMRRRGIDRARVLVVGSEPTASVVVDRLKRHATLGYEVVEVVDGAELVRMQRQQPSGRSRLAEIVRKKRVDEVVLALSGASDRELRDVIDLLQDETVSIKIYPDAFQLITQNEVSVAELSGLPLLTVKDVVLRGWNRRLKRAFDIVFSLAVLVLTAPLMLLIAAAIKLTSPGPVFFIQTRVGLDGKPFRLVKFRTMRVDVNGEEVPKLREGMPGWTVPNDPRRTKLGAILRRFSLDELPQFYNVLIGEMSVVGPRPEQPEYVQEFAKRWGLGYLRRHREKAGITGWAQVNGLRGDSSIELRTLFDLYYVENWSLLFDLKIIVRTIWAMFMGKNAY
jgi:Undecaprenyl-phosphate glucose phosphotransferase